MKEHSLHTSLAIPMESKTKISFNLLVLFGFVLVYIGRIQEIFSFLTPLRLGLLVQALAIPVAFKLVKDKEYWLLNLRAPETRTLLALFCFGLLSALFSSYMKASILFMLSFIRNVAFYLLIINIIKSVSDLRKTIWCFIAAMILLGLPALISKTTGRLTSLDASYDANDLALLIVTVLPFVLLMIPITKSRMRIVLIAAVPLLLIVLVGTGSRGGFLGFAAVAGLFFFKSRLSVFRKLIIVFVMFTAFFYLAPDSLHERLATINSDDYNTSDNFGRINIWKRNIVLWTENPLFGVGPGSFAIANGFRYADQVGGAAWDMTAHNSFLLVLVEMGVVGAGLFLAFVIRSLMSMRRLQKVEACTDELIEINSISRAIEASLVGFIVSGFFLSFSYQPLIYYLIGLGVACRTQQTAILRKDQIINLQHTV